MIYLKSPSEIEKISNACRLAGEVLISLRSMLEAGVTTKELERVAEEKILKAGGVPAFKGYRGFPACICTSVNEEVVHGIPSSRRLSGGDIVSIDIGVYMDGYYGDAAVTIPIGRSDRETAQLLRVTEEALYKGIEKAIEGNRVSDISHGIQQHVEKHGFSVVRLFVGHGIGRELHEAPQIPNYGSPGHGPKLKKGMTLAIEPMVNAGTEEVRVLDDGWTAITCDGKKSAHFEHTILVTSNTPKILTKYK